MNNNKTAKIITFGCQMNVHDSEKIRAMLESLGYDVTDTVRYPDLTVVNTCCVRKTAEDRALGHIGELKHVKEHNKNAVIAVCGCMTQQEAMTAKLTQSYEHVDIIFGALNLSQLPELLREHEEKRRRLVNIKDEPLPFDTEVYAKPDNPYKAYINIMYGCDNFCSYCIVPYVRGRERSREPSSITAEAKQLVASGIKEITLLGQNVNSYGKGLKPDTHFAELLRSVSGMPGLLRLRFVTSHPKDLSDDLIQAMSECENVCPALHLPIQSGSSRILGLMNRGYTKEEYIKLIGKLRAAIPNLALTTDIIVGFPGETDEDFAETLDVVEKVRFLSAFTFIYAKRDNTPAAKLKQNASKKEIMLRFDRLRTAVNDISYEINKGFVGKTLPVLVEKLDNKTNLYEGRSPENILVHIKKSKNTEAVLGKIIKVRITSAKTFYLSGETEE